MVALAAIQQQLRVRNTTLQTTLSTLQHTLTSSVRLEAKDSDYVVLADMMANSPELKNMPAEMKVMQDEEAVFLQRVQETGQALENLETELKKPPAEKAVLNKIKKELNTLLTPKDCKAPESTLDDLLALAAKKLGNAEFKKNFDVMLKKKIRIHEKSVLIKDYIVLNELEKEKKYFGLVSSASTYLPLLSSTGKALADDVVREEDLKKQLTDLQKEIAVDEEKVQQLNARVIQFQTRCAADIKKHVDQAKVAAEKIFENIKKAEKLLDEMEAVKAQAENRLIVALGKNPGVEDLSREMAQTLSDMESGEANAKALEATQLLADASTGCENNQGQFGQARIWKKLPKKISEQRDRLGKRETALQHLREKKASIDTEIEAKNRLPENNERVEPLPVNNNNAEAARYKIATDEYLERLSKSINKHLILFKQSEEENSEDRYLLVARHLGLTNKTEVSDVLPLLEKAYRYDGDKALQQEIDKVLMPVRKDEQQESLRHTLHKYRLMTELRVAADESSQKFTSMLAKEENRTLLAKRRDNSFMLWAKGCGKIVADILGVLDATYGRFFASRGESFAKNFGRVAENIEPDERARPSLSRSAGS